MYLSEDISKLLENSNPTKIMNLLLITDRDLPIETVYQKLLLSNAWALAGKPESKLPRLKEYLGKYWEAYLNPFTERLQRLSLKDIISSDISKNLTKDHKPIISEILHKKLHDYIEHQGVTRLAVVKDFPVKTKDHKIMIYKLTSKYADIPIITVTLDWLGFVYTARVSFLDLGYISKDLTEESLKKIKKSMYDISSDWDINKLEGLVKLIEFDDIILDCLTQNILGYSNT